jgi:hypothetical protein
LGLTLTFFFLARVNVALPTVVTATGWVCAVVHIDGETQEPPLGIDTLDFFFEGHPTTKLKTNCFKYLYFPNQDLEILFEEKKIKNKKNKV